MKNITLPKRKFFTSMIASVLMASFVIAPISITFKVNEANALFGAGDTVVIVGDATEQSWGTWLEGKITALSTAASSISGGSLVFKEYTLDTIGWGLVNILLQEMIRSTTAWVNSGFQGSPAFVSNLSGFMGNLADQVAGDIIWGSGLSALCSPFKLDIQIAISLQYAKTRGGYKSQCTLTQVTGNIESFLNGDFVSGDWDDWYNVTLRPDNNPHGAMLQAQAGMSLNISNSQSKNLSILNFGEGFLTREECKGQGLQERCYTITPGSVIEGQLNSSLAGSQRRLEIADELNELVGALFSQLVKQALGGVGGLLGLTDNSNNVSGYANYFDAMSAEKTPESYSGFETENPFPKTLATQQTYLNLQNEIIDLITDAAAYKDTVYGDSCTASGALTSSLNSKLTTAQTSKVSVSELINTLAIYDTDYALLRNESTPAETLAVLLITYDAKNVTEAKSELMMKYNAYVSSGELYTDADNVRTELQTIRDLATEISTFKSQIDRQCEDTNSGN